MRSDPRPSSALWSVLVLVVASVLGLAACRELTTPTQETPAMILARGYVHDIEDDPIAEAQVTVELLGDGLETAFRSRTRTDQDGRFELWVPNQVLRVLIRPPSGSHLPSYDNKEIIFFAGKVHSFGLIGIPFHGTINAKGYEDYLTGGEISFSTTMESAGSSERIERRATIHSNGRFTAYLPREGHYQVMSSRSGSNFLRFTWPDSVAASEGDSILLELPIVEITVDLRLGNQALPALDPNCVECTITQLTLDGFSNRIGTRILGDDSRISWTIPAMDGAQRLRFGSCGSIRYWAPIFMDGSPLQGGEDISVELGRYELAVIVVDPDGEFLDARIYFSTEDSRFQNIYRESESPHALFKVNPIGHQMEVHRSEYFSQYSIFEVHGDTTITVVLQPIQP